MEYYITKDIDELQNMIDEARHQGCYNIDLEFEPYMFNLVDEDDRPELENIDTDDLREELERRTKEEYAEIECNITDIAQKVIEKSPAAAREFFTDILGLTHLASVDEICNAIKEKIGEKRFDMYHEIPYEVDNDTCLTKCPYDCRIDDIEAVYVCSIYCRRHCQFFYGIDKEKKIVKCTHKVEE